MKIIPCESNTICDTLSKNIIKTIIANIKYLNIHYSANFQVSSTHSICT